jgi:hypothetical protein
MQWFLALLLPLFYRWDQSSRLAIRFRWWLLTTARVRRVKPWVTLTDEAEKLKAEMAKSADGVRAIPYRIDQCRKQMLRVMTLGATSSEIAAHLYWSKRDVCRVLDGRRPLLRP